MFPTTAYNPPEDSLSQDVIATVEKSMKKYADNLMRFLEGISSRLSQLELYCYNLDKSIGEMKSDINRDHVEQDSRLKSLEKHVQEVHRSVQILRDKQELAETQKELAKLQLAQKDPSPPVQQFSHYQQPQQQQQPPQQQQQQWSQQVQPSQPPPMQSQVRPSSPNVYPPYQPNQATNPSPAETLPNSMAMQMPYSGVPPQGSNRADAIPYGYGGAGRTVPQQPPPQQMKSSFPAPPGEMYGPTGSLPALPPPSSAYMMYDGEGGRSHHPPQPPHFAQPGYPPTSASLQNPPQGHNLMVRNPNQSQFVRNHPYNELVEKLVSMGFRGDHVASVIQRMEESGQAVDFNSVLDRLSSVGPQRGGWSG
ncbi:hypothetical protein GYH30_016602 [Glycine max]|nr:hypothetical protein GYH30_016602 [Glycine max]